MNTLTLVVDMSFSLALKPVPMSKISFYTPDFTMCTIMSLEERIDTILKNNQAISTSNQELKYSNQELKIKISI